MSPICQTCGSYYVRPPCPACIDLDENYKDKKAIVPTSARLPSDLQQSAEVTESPAKSESLVESSSDVITKLKMQLDEKDKEIKLLRQSLLHIREEIERQMPNK